MANVASRDKVYEAELEAGKLVKNAKKLIAPSILDLRMKPDWESATPLFERAAQIYKQNGFHDQAIDALERASTGQEKQGSPWHAAKSYEQCGELSKQKKDFENCARFYQLSGNLFVEAGKPTTAGEVLTRGARAVEEAGPEAAMKLYYDALDIYETYEKESYSVDTFRLAIAFLVKQQRWEEAVEMQMRFGLICDKVEARSSQMKAYLGAVVTWLYAGDAKAAWQTFQDAMNVDYFAQSREAFAADELFQAYRDQDEEGIVTIVKKRPEFKNLDNRVAKLAMQLPQGKLRRMARQLNRILGEAEELETEQAAEANADEVL